MADINTLQKKIVKLEEELSGLKGRQIIGYDNSISYEYGPIHVETNPYMKNYESTTLLLFVAIGDFPIVSCSIKNVMEDGVPVTPKDYANVWDNPTGVTPGNSRGFYSLNIKPTYTTKMFGSSASLWTADNVVFYQLDVSASPNLVYSYDVYMRSTLPGFIKVEGPYDAVY